MASLFTHAVAAATLGQAGKRSWRARPAFWWVAVVCSALPDIDVLGFKFGVRYGDPWGHRGITHSLLFALLVAICAAGLLRSMNGERWKLVLLLFFITASHGLLDAMTNGGLGIAFFSPFDFRRYFLPWRPVQVSPIGAGAFFSERGVQVLWSEIVWLWLPLLAIGGMIRLIRKVRRDSKLDELKET